MGGRSRTLILIGVVVLLGGILVVALLLGGGLGRGGAAVQATATPQPTLIVVAVQEIPRGTQILSETVALREWPPAQLPPGFLTDINQVLGQYARFDIPKGLPILPGMIAESPRALVVSELSKQIPAGKVAVALPVTRLSSVAYALKAGDHVDALASFWVLDLDEEFQTRLTNNYLLAVPGKEGDVTFMAVSPGGRDRAGVLGFPAQEQPAEGQRARLVTQLTVQNMEVLGVGDWLSQQQPAAQPQSQAQQGQQQQQAQPTPAAPVLDIVTVIVDPQDALVLKFLREVGASIDLALRSAKDLDSTFVTESVTVQYTFTRFVVAVPPKLRYGIEPAPTPTPMPQP